MRYIAKRIRAETTFVQYGCLPSNLNLDTVVSPHPNGEAYSRCMKRWRSMRQLHLYDNYYTFLNRNQAIKLLISVPLFCARNCILFIGESASHNHYLTRSSFFVLGFFPPSSQSAFFTVSLRHTTCHRIGCLPEGNFKNMFDCSNEAKDSNGTALAGADNMW